MQLLHNLRDADAKLDGFPFFQIAAASNLFLDVITSVQDRSRLKIAAGERVVDRNAQPLVREKRSRRDLKYWRGRNRNRRDGRANSGARAAQWTLAGSAMRGRWIIGQSALIAKTQQRRLLHRFLYSLKSLKINHCLL